MAQWEERGILRKALDWGDSASCVSSLFGFIAAFLMSPIVSADPRFTLIIGNGNYSSAGMQLSNPVNDAQAMNRAKWRRL
jgi:hypothetical protein